MPGNDLLAMPLHPNASWAAQQVSDPLTSSQNHQDHGYADSTDEDDDGGVAIPSNTTSPLSNAENLSPGVGFAQQQAAHSIASQAEASGTTAMSNSQDNSSPDVPMAISQLSQQLAQMQEELGTELEIGMFGHIGSVHNNSTPPTLPFLPHISPLSTAFNDDEEEETYTSSDNVSVSIAAPPTAIAMSQMYPPPMAEMHNATAPDTLPPFAHWIPINGIQNVDFGIVLNNADVEFLGTVDVDQNSYTLSMYDFLWTWGHRSRRPFNKKKGHGPNLGSLQRQRIAAPKYVQRRDLQGDQCDIQGMNWSDMEVTREEAREARSASYKNYESIPTRSPYCNKVKKDVRELRLPDVENYLRFRRMDLQRKPHLSHFQLRNLIACTSRSNVFFAGKHKVHHVNPLADTSFTIMDLSDHDNDLTTPYSFDGGVQISTIAAKHDILLAGGFNGEYGMINLRSSKDSGHVSGVITDSPGSITNHISLSLSRSSGLPQATFASNDNGIRLLDCTTNKVVAAHTYPFPVNCTAVSPDNRLRVIVGDTTSVHICDTEKGTTVQQLEGHCDFGFACAWADNGWHVATGNQDMTVKIWDARMWNDRHGNANPLETIHSELAGVRSLQFSPLGSGKRILLACEAADVIDVIDAESYKSKQVLDFFGEIGGACFTPDGQDIFVANCDSLRGGILEFERTGEGARMDYRLSRKDVEDINRDVSRRKTRVWLNSERDAARNPNYVSKSKATAKPGAPHQGAIHHARTIPRDHGGEWKSLIGTCTDDAQVIGKLGESEEKQMDETSPSSADRPQYESSSFYKWSRSEEQDQQLQRHQDRMDWTADVEDMLDSEDDGYTSIGEKMRQQARGYDWRQTDAKVIADSRSNGRTLSWHRRKHLFADSGMEPLMGGGEGAIDIGL